MFNGSDDIRFENQFVMIGAELARHDAREIRFVEIVVLESDGESLDRAGTCACHQGDNGRRVSPAAEKRAQRNVRDQADASGLVQTALQLFQTFFLALGEMSAVLRKVPILTDVDFTVREFQQIARRQLVNSGEDSNRIGHVAEIQIFEQALRIDFGQFWSHGQDRLNLRREVKLVPNLRIMKRLLAQTVPGQNKFALHLVINGQRKHAAQFLDAIRAQILVEMNDDFCIASGIEAMSAPFQLGTQLGKIVDLAVVDDPCAAIFVEHRLMSASEIDDAQAAHAQTGAVLDEDAFIVGPTVDDLIAHVADQRLGDVAFPSCAYDSSDTTHTFVLSFHASRGGGSLIWNNRYIHEALKTIVAVLAWIAFAAIASGHQDIGHFTCGNKVQGFLPLRCASDKFFQKFPEGAADDSIFLAGIHTVAM